MRSLAVPVTCGAIALLLTACPTVKTWLGITESRCIAFCALDTDEACKGRRPGEYDSCVEKCKRPTSYECTETQQELEGCQSSLSCGEYRDYATRRSACAAEWRAHEECAGGLRD